ncbi:MAG: hypothetical protein PHD02_03250 [Bacilli bacterium]|nr:hypothetical protein [Bacilli bacterium]
MEGNKIILGHYERQVDAKGRIIIPPTFLVPPKEEMAICQDNDMFFKIYRLECLKGLVIKALNKRDGSIADKEIYSAIQSRIDQLMSCILEQSHLDNQRRMIIPAKSLPEEGRKVILLGSGDHIKLFNKSSNYDLFVKENRSHILL